MSNQQQINIDPSKLIDLKCNELGCKGEFVLTQKVKIAPQIEISKATNNLTPLPFEQRVMSVHSAKCLTCGKDPLAFIDEVKQQMEK